ncbi:cilium assembly protein DZIP1 isoform 1 [Danio rerio]|uniref:Cilium assembly protein DZIP1 n=2 Tax=Danio rerio TaxID=7955 RepID=F1QNW2_DANRE|nr:cilium assembly protein DZIP1 isoform 1 [Danio rerio]|eukprot:NP_001299827.1 zinc finger protein Dzip1 isoform 1 [Danio rerio]
MPFYDNVYYPYPSDPPGTHSSAGIPSLLSSPQSQPSSGSQSRPAPSTMSGPLTSSGASTSIPPPYKFRSRRENVDWRRINAVDVDRVACEMDFQALQEHINAVTFCSVEGERCHRCQSPVDPALIKLFRLAQLTVEYLLHSQDCLSISLQAAEERLLAEAREREQICVQLQKKTQDAKALKEELKQRKKIIASQQAMFSAGISANYHKCQHCEKAFMNASFLQSHMQRRHPSEFDMKLMTDNQKKIQTVKLQDEINKLQEQLTLVTSQMETQQKDYTAKQEKELIQRQEEFKRQLEIWKEEEKMRMNSKIDEVKQACQRDMDSMHQRNRNLETELLKLQQKNIQESMQSVQTQPNASASNEHWQEVVKLQQKLHKQEVKWTGKMQKMKEDHDREKSLLQEELCKVSSAVSEGMEESRRQVQELSHRLQEQQQIITSQNKQMKQISSKPPTITVQREGVSTPSPETKAKVVVSEQSNSVHKLDPIVELSEEDKDSSSISESPTENRSWQKEVQELLKNPGLRRDMRLAAQHNLDDRLQSLGIKGVSGLSKNLYKSSMTQIISDRRKKLEEDPVYRRALKEISHKLEQRVKERNTEQPVKPKLHEQVVQSRPRSSSFPSTVTRVMSGPASKQQRTPQPVPRSRSNVPHKTSTPLQHRRTPPFSSDEDSSEEEEEEEEEEESSDEESPQMQKKTVLVNSSTAKAQNTAKTQSTAQSVRPAVALTSAEPTNVTTLSDSDWSDGSEMEEINLSQLHKHTDQNGNLKNVTHSNVKALGKSLEKQLAARGPKKPAGGVNTFLEKPTEVRNTRQNAKKELKYSDDDDDDDDWDISSLEDVPAVAKPTQCPVPVRKSLDKSQDTSTSVWGSSTGKGHKPGLTDAGTASTLKSSLVTVSDWDDSDEI